MTQAVPTAQSPETSTLKCVTFYHFNCCGSVDRCPAEDIEARIFVENAEQLMAFIQKMGYRRWLPVESDGAIHVVSEAHCSPFPAGEGIHDEMRIARIFELERDAASCRDVVSGGRGGPDVRYNLVNPKGKNLRMVVGKPDGPLWR